MQNSTSMQVVPEAFVHPVHVRFLELDSHAHVFHMWYLAYFDDAMTAYFLNRGVPYEDIFLQIVHTEIDWKSGARRGDVVHIAVRPVRMGTTSFTLEFEVLRGEERTPVALGRTVYVHVGNDGQGGQVKKALPDALRRALA